MRRGWQVAGLAGLLAAMLAINVPHCAFTYVIVRITGRAGEAIWLRAMKEALVLITTGPILAGCVVMGRAADHGPLSVIVTAITTGFIVLTDWNPLWMLAAASLAGLVGAHAGWAA